MGAAVHGDRGRLVKVQRRDGFSPSDPFLDFLTFTTDSDGNRLTAADAVRSLTFTYDGMSRLTSVTDAAANQTSFAYDAVGNRTSVTDALLRETRFVYDALDRLTQVQQDDGATVLETEFAYDAAGNVIQVTDPKDQRTDYAYDRLSRLTSVTQELGIQTPGIPDDYQVAYAYDARGRLDTVTNARGQVLDYDYEPWGGLASVDHVGASRTVSYGYDLAGNLASAGDSELSASPLYSFSYDPLNRVDTVTAHYLPGGDRTLDADYDAFGNRDELVFTDGAESFTLQWVFDALDRLETARLPVGATLSFGYYDNDDLEQILYPSGVTSDYTYHPEGPIDTITVRDASLAQLLKLDYAVDALLHVDTLDEEHDGSTSYPYDYDYDGFQRLSRAQLPAALNLPPDTSFPYDDAGNRDDDPTPGNGPWQYDANNRIAESPASPANVSYTFDDDGNTLTKSDNGTLTTYTWDATNRLRQADVGGTVSSYAYDPFGRRLRKTVSGVTTWYLWDGDQLLAEYDSSGTRQVRYAYAGGFAPARVAYGSPTETLYDVHTDHLDTPRLLTDNSSGTPAWRAAYEAFGKASLDPGNSVTFNIRFPGQYFDAETGLHDNRFRYYSPELGRYISADPIGQLDQLNLYNYAGLNPLIFVDPLGLKATIVCNRCKGDAQGSLSCTATDDQGTKFSFTANTGDSSQNYPNFDPSKGDPYGSLGPIPSGTYDVVPRKSSDGKYPPGTPAITQPGKAPGSVTTPKGTDRTHLYFHGPGRTDGCLACDGGGAKAVKDLMDRNANSGGTTLTVNETDCNGRQGGSGGKSGPTFP